MRLRSNPLLFLAAFLGLILMSCEAPAELPSSVLSADGLPIHFEVHGTGEPALVFVHGWSCDRSYWDAQVPYFSNRHRVVTVDLAGHGESGLGRGQWTMRAFGEDVAAVVEGLDLGQVVLVGHSMGGPVVVEAARLLGDRVLGIVGADTFNDVSLRYPEEQVLAFREPFLADFREAMRGAVSGMFVPVSDSALMNQILEDMSSGDPGVGIGALEGMATWFNAESEDALRALRVPVRLINSDYQSTNVDAGREYVPSFEAVFMSGVGHFVMIEDPETFNGLLEGFVEEFTGSQHDGSED